MASALLCTVLLVSSVAAAVMLARSAVGRWSAERSARVYELPVDYRPAALRALAAAAILATAIALVVELPAGPYEGEPAGAGAAAEPEPNPAPPAAGRPAADAHPAPPPPAPDQPRTLGRPAGGTLQEFPDGTRVWLPPQYDAPAAARRAFPLVVVCVPPGAPDADDVYPAFAPHTAPGFAQPFVLVLPRDCLVDPSAAVDAVAHRYRVLPDRSARAVLGIDTLASWALRDAFGHPERYQAAVGVSGTYDTRYSAARPDQQPHVLLATVLGEDQQRASAQRLQRTLRRNGARVRTLERVTVDPRLGGGPRRRALALAAGYLTHQLRSPGEPPTATR